MKMKYYVTNIKNMLRYKTYCVNIMISNILNAGGSAR